jgi:TRAP-type mannitol/chloroaromatic compound transport system permease large subunit
VFLGSAWFLPISVALLVLMIFFPHIVTWLPEQMSER